MYALTSGHTRKPEEAIITFPFSFGAGSLPEVRLTLSEPLILLPLYPSPPELELRAGICRAPGLLPGCWDPNFCPRYRSAQAFLIAEPSLQPLQLVF